MLVSSSPTPIFAHLFGPGVEPGYRPIHLPKLHIVTVDEPPGGFDGGLIINTIQLNHANGSVVSPNDICTIDRHLNLQEARNSSLANLQSPHGQSDSYKPTARSGCLPVARKITPVAGSMPT